MVCVGLFIDYELFIDCEPFHPTANLQARENTIRIVCGLFIHWLMNIYYTNSGLSAGEIKMYQT